MASVDPKKAGSIYEFSATDIDGKEVKFVTMESGNPSFECPGFS